MSEDGKSSLTISRKRAGVWAMSQRLILKGGRIGLRSYMQTSEKLQNLVIL